MVSIQEYRFAESLEEAAELLAQNRRNAILGGGMWLRLGKKSIHTAIDLSRLHLDAVEVTEDEIRIGAMTTLRQIETDPVLQSEFGGAVSECVRSIVGVQFRNSATAGASVYGRYGFSDLITALLALDAEVELHRAGRMRLEDFLQTPPERDILTHIDLPRDGRRAAFASLRRTKTDFAIVNLCLSEGADSSFAVSVGARPNVAVRCPAAERLLKTGDLAAAEKAVMELNYGSNMRGSAGYRAEMAAVLLRRAYAALREVDACR